MVFPAEELAQTMRPSGESFFLGFGLGARDLALFDS